MSTVHKGAFFESLCTRVLLRYGFHLQRKGGAGDLGIDLQGFWQVGTAQQVEHSLEAGAGRSLQWPLINLIVQCKHEKTTCKPAYIRELDGVLSRWGGADHAVSGFFLPRGLAAGHPHLHNCQHRIPLLGAILCSSGYSASCMTALNSSMNPMMCMVINAEGNEDQEAPDHALWLQSRLQFCKLNQAAQRILPHLSLAPTFATGEAEPSLVLINEGIDITTHRLPLPKERPLQ